MFKFVKWISANIFDHFLIFLCEFQKKKQAMKKCFFFAGKAVSKKCLSFWLKCRNIVKKFRKCLHLPVDCTDYESQIHHSGFWESGSCPILVSDHILTKKNIFLGKKLKTYIDSGCRSDSSEPQPQPITATWICDKIFFLPGFCLTFCLSYFYFEFFKT